jgi:hypothetical protein
MDGPQGNLHADSLHSDTMRSTGKQDRHTKRVEKAYCVIDYDKNMGAVDRTNMMITSIECVRKSLKWYRQFFPAPLGHHPLEFTCTIQCKNWQEHICSRFSASSHQIIQKYHIPRQTSKREHPSDGDQPLRLTKRHFPYNRTAILHFVFFLYI